MTGSIQKKGKSYYLVFRMRDPQTRKRKQKWIPAGKTKRGAERKLAELMGEVLSGTYRDIKTITFAEFSELWLDSYAKTRTKPSTIETYCSIIKKHLIPAFGDYLLTEIDAGMVQKYVASKLESLKPKTLVNHVVPLKEMFKHAVRWGYLRANPAEHVERPRVEREEMDILTPDEIRLFLDHARPTYKALFLTAVLTGMRRGELLGLQWSDIDWNSNQIHVRRSLWKDQFITPKSKTSIRRIDMSPYLASELKKHKLSSPNSEVDLVFCNSKGNRLDPETLVKKEFQPALRRAKIRRVSFHSLRHSNVALRIAEGQNLKYIQNQLGHASIQTTLDTYGHLVKEHNTEQAKRLDNGLGFAEQSEGVSDSVRRLLEEKGKRPSKSLSSRKDSAEPVGTTTQLVTIPTSTTSSVNTTFPASHIQATRFSAQNLSTMAW
jgi:integrase